VSASLFADKISIRSTDSVKKAKGPGVPRFELLSHEASTFAREDEPTRAFAAALRDSFLNAARWLAKQSSEVFECLRAAGYETDIFIGVWIDSDQLDVDLPPEFLLECGRLGLTISIITND
jgi:hypothetical protein